MHRLSSAVRSCHLCPFESRNHYSNDGLRLPLLLAPSNALLNPNSELFSPAGIKKRHRIARRTRTDQIKFHPRPIHRRESFSNNRKDAPRQGSPPYTAPRPRYSLMPRWKLSADNRLESIGMRRRVGVIKELLPDPISHFGFCFTRTKLSTFSGVIGHHHRE